MSINPLTTRDVLLLEFPNVLYTRIMICCAFLQQFSLMTMKHKLETCRPLAVVFNCISMGEYGLYFSEIVRRVYAQTNNEMTLKADGEP